MSKNKVFDRYAWGARIYKTPEDIFAALQQFGIYERLSRRLVAMMENFPQHSLIAFEGP